MKMFKVNDGHPMCGMANASVVELVRHAPKFGVA